MGSYPPNRRIIPNDFFLSELMNQDRVPDFYGGVDSLDNLQLDPRSLNQRPDIPDIPYDPSQDEPIPTPTNESYEDVPNNKFGQSFNRSLGSVADFAKNLITHPIDTVSEAVQSPFKSALGGIDQAIGNLAGAPTGMPIESGEYIKHFAPEMSPGVTEGIKAGLKVGLPAASPGSEILAEPLGKLAEGNIQEGAGELAGLGLGGYALHKLTGGAIDAAKEIPDFVKDVEPAIRQELPFKYSADAGIFGSNLKTKKPTYQGQEVEIVGRRGNTVRIKLPDGTEQKVGFSDLGKGLEKFPKNEPEVTPEVENKLQNYREQVNQEAAPSSTTKEQNTTDVTNEPTKTKYSDITKELEDLLGKQEESIQTQEIPKIEEETPTISPEDVSIVVPDKNIIPEYAQFPKPGRPGIQGPKLPSKNRGGQLPPSPPNKPPNEPPIPPEEGPKRSSEYGLKDRISENLANFVSGTKRMVMSTGVPGTGINPHGFSTLARSVGKETPGSFAQGKALAKTVHYMVNPSAAEASLNLGKVDLERFNEAAKEQGLGSFAGAEGLERVDTHGKLSELFETPLFRKIIPALKMEHAKSLESVNLASGMEPSRATALAVKQAAETFGGLNNWSKSAAARIVLFAPDWLETQASIAKGAGRNLTTPNSPEGKLYRNLILNTAAVYAIKEIAQRSLGQGSTLTNAPGHEADLRVGHDKEDREINIRPEATAFDFARIPYEAVLAAKESGGDLRKITRPLYNRLSPPMKIAVDLLSNTDFAGRPISGKDSYGKEIPFWDSGQTKSGKPVLSAMRRLTNELTQLLPGPIQAISQAVQNQKGYNDLTEAGLEIGSRSIGLPISFTSTFEPKKIPDVSPLGTNLKPRKKKRSY